jgi:Ca2+-binding EF-hand superfamily protein
MEVAQMHARDLAEHLMIGHVGSDEAGLEERVARICLTSGSVAENIDYGNETAQEIVCSLLIDDGMYARGQRINIMKKDHKCVGASVTEHKDLGSVCVIIFAEKVLDESADDQTNQTTSSDFNDMTLNLEEVKDLRVPGESSSFSYDFQQIKAVSRYEEDLQPFDDPSETKNTIIEEELSHASAFKDPSKSRMMTLIDEEVTLSMSKTELDVQTQAEDEEPKPIPTTKPPLFPRPKAKNDEFLVSNFERSELSKDGVDEIKELFDIYDTSGSGFLDSHALKAMKDQLSECSGSEVIQVLCNLDPGEKIGFQDLVELVSEKLSISKSRQKSVHLETGKGKKSFDPSLYVRPEFNKRDILEIKAAFDMFDLDGTGTISPFDLKKALKTQGFEKKNSIIMKLINEIPVESSEKVNFGEFIDLLASEDSNSESEIRKLFNIFDVEGSGFIELVNLKKIVKELGDTLDEQDIILLFRQSDRDGDGRVSYLDFYNTMKRIKF